MSIKKTILIIGGFIILVLLGLGLIGYYAEKTEKPSQKVNTVMITDQGFEPATVEVDIGKPLCFEHSSEDKARIFSLIFKDFKGQREVKSNYSWCRNFKKPGNFKYYLEDNPEIKGKIIVKENL